MNSWLISTGHAPAPKIASKMPSVKKRQKDSFNDDPRPACKMSREQRGKLIEYIVKNYDGSSITNTVYMQMMNAGMLADDNGVVMSIWSFRQLIKSARELMPDSGFKKEKICELVKRGVSAKEIKDKLGCNRNYIYQVRLEFLGITDRKKGGEKYLKIVDCLKQGIKVADVAHIVNSSQSYVHKIKRGLRNENQA